MSSLAISMVQYPLGYTNILFVNELPDGPNFFVAEDIEMAAKKANPKFPTYPLPYGDLIKHYKMPTIRNFLLRFGDSWITKEGMIFFKKRLSK